MKNQSLNYTKLFLEIFVLGKYKSILEIPVLMLIQKFLEIFVLVNIKKNLEFFVECARISVLKEHKKIRF